MNYFVKPLTEARLSGLLKKAGLRPYEVLRRGESAFKELGLNIDTPNGEIIKAIVDNPGLLQRPIVEVGDIAVLARPVDKALKLLKSQGII